LVAEVPTVKVVERNPDDDIFLSYTVAGDAEYVVSGDGHMLSLGSLRGVLSIKL
jgi:predicted nucleic acid-binding protein